MSKILMLTNIFPIPDMPLMNGTSVCHYFAKEWVKKGHQVVVVYNYTIYTPILHALAFIGGKTIASHCATVINKKRFKCLIEYEMDGIKIFLLPCYKFMPKISFPQASIDKQVNTIDRCIRNIGFNPDVIVGHFLHPNIEIIPLLKLKYNVKTAIVLHGEISSYRDINMINQYKDSIDLWGFRSFPIKKSFERNIGECKNEFMCFSGVPENYISLESYTKMTDNMCKYIYVGNLVKRKFPIIVVKALSKFYKKKSFDLSIIGTGGEERNIRSFLKRNGIEKNVRLCGRLLRTEVRQEMFNAECFIMISKAETFGLVYLEAMANGCITIASKDEGMEGIIIDGYNGFLCQAGNLDELIMKIGQINSLSKKERMIISKNAIQTAIKMTDAIVAEKYLNSLLK